MQSAARIPFARLFVDEGAGLIINNHRPPITITAAALQTDRQRAVLAVVKQ